MMTSGIGRLANYDRRKNLAAVAARGKASARRPRHRPPAQEVQVEMKHRLAAVGVGVHDDAIAPLGEPRVPRQIAREPEETTQQLGIPCVVERREVIGGNHEQVRGRLRIQVLESHDPVRPLYDRRRDLAGGTWSVAVPWGVGTSTSAPSAAWVKASGRS